MAAYCEDLSEEIKSRFIAADGEGLSEEMRVMFIAADGEGLSEEMTVMFIAADGEGLSEEMTALGYPKPHRHQLVCLRQELIDAFVEYVVAAVSGGCESDVHTHVGVTRITHRLLIKPIGRPM